MHDWSSCLEVFVDETWMRFGHVEALLRHDFDLIGSIFGVYNEAQFRPLFSSRGFPADVNRDFLASIQEAVACGATLVDASWISFEELRAVPWNEEALAVDPRLYKYKKGPDGAEVLIGTSMEYVGADRANAGGPDETGSWLDGDTVYRRRRLRRLDLLENSDFPVLMDVCDVLAKRYGASNVRWVVAFLE